MNYSIPFVCAFGVLTVFCSLVVIIILTYAMSAVVRKLEKPAPAPASAPAAPAAPAAAPVAPVVAAPQQDPLLMAAITAAIAADLGVNFSNVTITAIKKV